MDRITSIATFVKIAEIGGFRCRGAKARRLAQHSHRANVTLRKR